MFKYNFVCMTVHCEVIIHGLSPQKAGLLTAEIEQQTRDLETRYNFHHPDSWLNQIINNRDQAQVAIDKESFNILTLVRDLSLHTKGYFDITVGTLSYKFRQNLKESLTEGAIHHPCMGLDQWQLEQDNQDYYINFNNADCCFDLGGVVKEYAVDKALSLIKESDALGGLVNFGGDIACCGIKENHKLFSIAVKNPKDPTKMLFSLDLDNQALTSSGHYERSRKVGNKQASHIIGCIQEDILQTTVVADSALAAGIFSTALTLHPELDLLDHMGKIIVDKNLMLHQ